MLDILRHKDLDVGSAKEALPLRGDGQKKTRYLPMKARKLVTEVGESGTTGGRSGHHCDVAPQAWPAAVAPIGRVSLPQRLA